MANRLHEKVESYRPESFRVDRKGRAPILDFMEQALRESGCALIHRSSPDEAPFRISFLAPWGERLGILAYAFTANARKTKNRPDDEHRFQIKYGSKDGKLHRLWQDPFGLYTTLLLGINAETGFFVGADPILNSPTRFFISKEFKQRHVDAILSRGWHSWEREQRRDALGDPVEILVGGTPANFLRYVLFEREVLAEEQGHRQLVADRISGPSVRSTLPIHPVGMALGVGQQLSPDRLHALEREFDLSASEIMGLIRDAPRLKMAVRGWVAERHLQLHLEALPEVAGVEPIEQDGKPDFQVEMRRGNRPVLLECKNVLRTSDRAGHPRLDFMRTRAALGNPCSRYYSPREFDAVVACLHAATERWEFAGRRTVDMVPHLKCAGKLASRIVVDDAWQHDLAALLTSIAG